MAKNSFIPHEAATLFPMMPETEFQEFKKDIAENGQQEEIVVQNGLLIDGRNRLRACEELGIAPKIKKLGKDVDPWQFVISHNMHRRHLTTSQRSDIAAKIATMKSGSRTDLASKDARSIEDAAAQMNVSAASVDRAKKVHAKGSKAVKQALSDGKLPVSTAAALVTAVPNKKEQDAVLKQGKAAVKVAIAGAAKTPRKSKGNEKPSAANLFMAMQKNHFSGRHGLPQTIDAMADANGGRGEQYAIADESLSSFLAATKLMRGGKL